MIISKYSRGSYIHRALEKLSREPMSADRLRRDISSVSIARFHESIIDPLVGDGFIESKGGIYHITSKGEVKLAELGPVKDKLPPQFAKARQNDIMHNGTYDGKELKPQQNRLDGNDHFMWPSRVDNTLYYRDGRVVEMS
jgi:hypothetical protein